MIMMKINDGDTKYDKKVQDQCKFATYVSQPSVDPPTPAH